MLSPAQAHLICLGLVAADYVARAWRIQLLTRGVGQRIGFADAMAVNSIGDAACSLSPLRIAGEPARLGVLLSAGIPATAALVSITFEVLTAWPVILAAAAWLLLRYAPDWWSGAGDSLVSTARAEWPWVVAILVVTLAAWLWIRHSAPAASRHLRRPIRRLRVHWRRMPWSLLIATVPLTFINLASRVAILPVLAATLPDAPPLGAMLVGSFALLYSQLVLPTPSGAGVVDFGFLGGVAGNLGEGHAGLLAAWRLYTTGAGVILGLAAGAYRFGWRTLRGALAPMNPWLREEAERSPPA
jgi:uncharacterized membrane protein YbhN (UPF0104 family)